MIRWLAMMMMDGSLGGTAIGDGVVGLVSLGAGQAVGQRGVPGHAGGTSGRLVSILQGDGVNTYASAVDLSGGTADAGVWLCGGILAGDALPVGGVPGSTTGTHVYALPSSVEVLLPGAALEVDALPLLKAVVRTDASCAEAEVIDGKAVVGDAETLSVDAPLADAAVRAGSAVAGVVEVVVGNAGIAVASDQVEGLAVYVFIALVREK